MSVCVDIQKFLGSFTLDIQLQAESGVVGLLGASGSGKSMTLRCLAGAVTPDAGRIVLHDRVLFNARAKINLPARKRRVGLMFQNYALFPHMTVEQNIVSGIADKRRRKEILARTLSLLQIESLRTRRPSQLSGGQQQRVALARMMASEPELMMLDEPFSALDMHLREQIEPAFLQALRAYPGTVLYVSHNMEELYRICSTVMVIDQGRVIEQGATRQLFRHPTRVETARLLSCRNLSPIQDGNTCWGVPLAVPAPWVGIFRENVHLLEQPSADTWPGRICAVQEERSQCVVSVLLHEHAQALQAVCPLEQRTRWSQGQPVFVHVAHQDILPLQNQ